MRSKSLLLACVLAMCSFTAAAGGSTNQVSHVEFGFSPEGTAENLIVKLIDSASSDIKVLAYSFTSPVIVKALINAKRRGVQVSIAADASNVKSKPGSSALSALSTAGVSVRVVDQFKILHDKISLVDNRHLQTGSFNYSKSANDANSENVIVLWNAPDIAAGYAKHWKSRWDLGETFVPAY